MLDTVEAELAKIERAAEEAQAIDHAGDALTFLRSVYQNPSIALPVRMRAAIEALPFERPSLKATAALVMGGDFADRLEKAIERSRTVRVIGHSPHKPEIDGL
jgi:hypothetical protein